MSSLSPEERELRQKQSLLHQKQEALAQLELDLSTLQAELRSFERRYFLAVASKYAEIDRLQARLDEIALKTEPANVGAQRRFAEGSERAQGSARELQEMESAADGADKPFEPAPELRAMYLELARLFHPDLTLDPKEKHRRHVLMQRINAAYQRGDLQALHAMLEEEKYNPDSITGEDTGALLVKVLRKIAQVDKRIERLRSELEEVHQLEIYGLYETVIEAEKHGRNMLSELAKELDQRLDALRQQLKDAKISSD